MTGFTLTDLPIVVASAFSAWLFLDITNWARLAGMFEKRRRTAIELTVTVMTYVVLWGLPTATVFGSIWLWRAFA
jgi:hypothetical protein